MTMVEANNPPKNKIIEFGVLIGGKNRKNKEKQQKIKRAKKCSFPNKIKDFS